MMVTHGPLTSYMNQVNDADQLTELLCDVNIARGGGGGGGGGEMDSLYVIVLYSVDNKLAIRLVVAD